MTSFKAGFAAWYHTLLFIIPLLAVVAAGLQKLLLVVAWGSSMTVGLVAELDVNTPANDPAVRTAMRSEMARVGNTFLEYRVEDSLRLLAILAAGGALFLAFLSSKAKLLRSTSRIDNDHPSRKLRRLAEHARKTLDLSDLQVHYNPHSQAAMKSLSLLTSRHLILTNTSIKTWGKRRAFDFCLHHEESHLLRLDTLLSSCLIGLGFLAFAVFPALYLDYFLVAFGTAAETGDPILALARVTLPGLVLALYIFHRSFWRAFFRYKETEADQHACQTVVPGNDLPFKTGSPYHPAPELRRRCLRAGRTRLNLVPVLLVLFLVGQAAPHTWADRVFFAYPLAATVLFTLDLVFFKSFYIERRDWLWALLFFFVSWSARIPILLHIDKWMTSLVHSGNPMAPDRTLLSSLELNFLTLEIPALVTMLVAGLIFWRRSWGLSAASQTPRSPASQLATWIPKLTTVLNLYWYSPVLLIGLLAILLGVTSGADLPYLLLIAFFLFIFVALSVMIFSGRYAENRTMRLYFTLAAIFWLLQYSAAMQYEYVVTHFAGGRYDAFVKDFDRILEKFLDPELFWPALRSDLGNWLATARESVMLMAAAVCNVASVFALRLQPNLAATTDRRPES